MKSKKLLAIAIVSFVAVLGGLAITAAGPYGARPGWAATGAEQGRFMGRHGKMARLCGEERQARMERMVGFVESFAVFTPEQDQAWNGLTTALDRGRDRIDTTCATLAEDGEPTRVPDKLARLELVLETGLETLREVRPAVETFYATLDEDQKQALDALGARRHHRH